MPRGGQLYCLIFIMSARNGMQSAIDISNE